MVKVPGEFKPQIVPEMPKIGDNFLAIARTEIEENQAPKAVQPPKEEPK